jgi:hypothetical protein
MFYRKELARLRAQKQALVLESTLNRLALQTEAENLRSAASQIAEAAGSLRSVRLFNPFLLILAPVAGFFIVRSLRKNSGSLFDRILSAAKWIQPAIALWKSFNKHPENPAP